MFYIAPKWFGDKDSKKGLFKKIHSYDKAVSLLQLKESVYAILLANFMSKKALYGNYERCRGPCKKNEKLNIHAEDR